MEVEQVRTIFRHFCELFPRSKIRHRRSGASCQILAKIYQNLLAVSILQAIFEAFLLQVEKRKHSNFGQREKLPFLKIPVLHCKCIGKINYILKYGIVEVDEVSKSYRYSLTSKFTFDSHFTLYNTQLEGRGVAHMGRLRPLNSWLTNPIHFLLNIYKNERFSSNALGKLTICIFE